MATPCVAPGDPSYDVTLCLGDSCTSPISYVEIAGVGDITGPTNSVTVVDVTAHGASRSRRKVPTLIDRGTIAFPLFFTATEATQGILTGLLSIFESGEIRTYKMVFHDGSELYFNAYVTSFGLTGTVAGVQMANCALTIDGDPTWILAP